MYVLARLLPNLTVLTEFSLMSSRYWILRHAILIVLMLKEREEQTNVENIWLSKADVKQGRRLRRATTHCCH